MVDLDYFREINEHYGHEAGDRCIMEVVHVFNRILRESDILARFGGDEFTVLMPDTPWKEAMEMTDRVRKTLGEHDILGRYQGPVKKLTMSAGVASFPEHGEDVKKLKEMADQALYRAKEEGRDRVVCAGS
jgi:diguanylate cyclase (GGDEF)-like protein